MVPRSVVLPLSNTLRMHVREWGSTGPACVLIHGLAEGSFVWDEFAEDLASTYHVFALDLRGHGQSDWSPGASYELDDFVSDSAEALGALGIHASALIGHSLGGSIAARLTHRHPDLVDALVIIDAGPGYDPEHALHLQSQIRESCRIYPSVEEYGAWLRERRFMAPDHMLRRLIETSLVPVPEGGFQLGFDPEVATILSSADDSWWEPALRSIECPTLILRGAQSALFSRGAADKMFRTLRDPYFSEIRNAGHSVMNDNPAEFSRKTQEFLDKKIRRVSTLS